MAAIRLLQDDHFFELVELRGYVGKRANQQRRIRARIIGSEGKIRKLIEGLTNTEITIYKSTVVLVGHEEGLAAARVAIEMIAGGAEHGTVLNFLEKDSRSLDSIEIKGEVSGETVFENLVPGLADLSNKRNRRMRASQVDPEDLEAVELMMELGEDESITYSEEE